MSDLIREQRLDKNGVLNTKLVRPQGAQPLRNNPFPPVAAPSSSGDVFKSLGKVFTNPAEIAWDRMSKDDVTKIANYASDELEKNSRNANAMFDFYAELFRNEHVDSHHAKSLLEQNEVLAKVKSAFVEANGLDTEQSWTPEQYAAREEYVGHMSAFDEAFAASGAAEEPEVFTRW